LGEILQLSSTLAFGTTLIWITDKLNMDFPILIYENVRTGGTNTHDKGN
jgi:hypothetical protein